MVSSSLARPRRSPAAVIARLAVGVVTAPVSVFFSGLATVIYPDRELMWLGLVVAIVLIAAAILLSRWSPLTGFVAGGLMAVIMLYFLAVGMVPGTSRPTVAYDAIISFGAVGLLTAALISAYVVTALAVGIPSAKKLS